MSDIELCRKNIEKLHRTNLREYRYCSMLYDMVLAVEEEDEALAKAECQRVKNIAAAGSRDDSRFVDLYWNATLFLARHHDVDSAFIYLEKNRERERRFYLPRREEFRKFGVIRSMQDLIDDKLDLLTISMPPGTGKSTAGIYFLSCVMGWWPDEPNLASAHSGTLTRSFYDGVQQIITDMNEYTWSEIFPEVELPDSRNGGFNAKEQTINIGNPKRFKSLTCRAIGASLTGATRCERILYADDLLSGLEEALSRERLDKLWQIYNTDLKTRKKNFCKEIHIQTRWSTGDVVGRLQREHEDDPRARFIAIPALDEHGESNFNYKYGVGFDTRYFLDMQQSMDDVSFRCLFMNEPIEREGLLYEEDQIRRYLTLPAKEPDAVLGICDTKNKGADYLFLPCMYLYGQDYYMVDCICDDNSDYGVQYSRIARIMIDNKMQQCEFETNNGGDRVAENVAKEIEGKCNCSITTKYTTQNKETKIIVNADWVKKHVVFRDSSLYTPKSDYGRAMRFLLGYTVKGKNPHDDVPDGLASFALFTQNLLGCKATVFDSPF